DMRPAPRRHNKTRSGSLTATPVTAGPGDSRANAFLLFTHHQTVRGSTKPKQCDGQTSMHAHKQAHFHPERFQLHGPSGLGPVSPISRCLSIGKRMTTSPKRAAIYGLAFYLATGICLAQQYSF